MCRKWQARSDRPLAKSRARRKTNMAIVVTLDSSGAPTQQGSPLFARLGPRTERIVLGTAFIVVLFVVWQLVTALGIEPPILLPSPAGVADAFATLFSS